MLGVQGEGRRDDKMRSFFSPSFFFGVFRVSAGEASLHFFFSKSFLSMVVEGYDGLGLSFPSFRQ